MAGQYGYKVWLPIVLTLAVWMGLIFVIAALVSKTWADLFGLIYLMASPFIYSGLKSIIGVDASGTGAKLDRFGMRDVGQ